MTHDTPQDQDPRFRAVLTPSRSLSPRGFLVVMLLVGVVNAVTGILFLLLGAWPVLLFCGLDVLLVYVAFKLNYRDGRRSETIEISPRTVLLTRVDRDGRSQQLALNTYWARVRLAEQPSGATRLALVSHGREHGIGLFLSDQERRELADALSSELQAARLVRRPIG